MTSTQINRFVPDYLVKPGEVLRAAELLGKRYALYKDALHMEQGIHAM